MLPFLAGPLVPPDWTPLLALALLSQVVGQGLVIYAVGHLKPEVSGLGLLIQPVIAAVLGWVVYGRSDGRGGFRWSGAGAGFAGDGAGRARLAR